MYARLRGNGLPHPGVLSTLGRGVGSPVSGSALLIPRRRWLASGVVGQASPIPINCRRGRREQVVAAANARPGRNLGLDRGSLVTTLLASI